MSAGLVSVGQQLWWGFEEVDARWARVYAGLMAALRPREYVTLGLRHPSFDVTAGPVPYVCVWSIDDDLIALEIPGNQYLRGGMRLTEVQEAGLRHLGFEEPGSSPWFPEGKSRWRLLGGFMDVAALGVVLVEVGTLMGLAHPMLASVERSGCTGQPRQEPCLHLLTCSCGLHH
jgi:hypothetical protein